MTWNCAQCDTVNESVSSACAVCGQARSGRSAAEAPPGGRGAAPTNEWGAPLAAPTTVSDAVPPTTVSDALPPTTVSDAARPTAAATRWCQACGAGLTPELRFCGQCGADQFPVAVTPVGVGTAPRSVLPPPDDLYPPRGGVGRAIAAVLGVIFVALIAGIGAFVFASRSNESAAPSASSDPTSGAVNAGSSTTSTPSSSTTTTAPSSTTAPPTTAGAPPSSAGPGGNPLAPPGATASDLAALDLAQQLATALATKDTAALAKLEPGKSLVGYENLVKSTVVLKSSTRVSDNVYRLRLGLVAHEHITFDQSHVYCVTWVVDLAAGRVAETGEGITASEVMTGWVDPATMVDRVRASC